MFQKVNPCTLVPANQVAVLPPVDDLMARGFEPRGISDIEMRPNGERVVVIDSIRLEP